MARKALPKKDKLIMVGGAVPPSVKREIETIAQTPGNNRTLSQVVRSLLEEALQNRKQKAA